MNFRMRKSLCGVRYQDLRQDVSISHVNWTTVCPNLKLSQSCYKHIKAKFKKKNPINNKIH